MKVQIFGAAALSLSASASTVDRRSLVLDVCPTYLSMCECYEASLIRDCGWDSQAINGGQCKKGSTFNQYELEEMQGCSWTITTDDIVRDDTNNCKNNLNACSCKAHENEGCGWKSADEFIVDTGVDTVYDATNGATQSLKSLGECRWDVNPNTDVYELEDSNSILAAADPNHIHDCADAGCAQHKNPCDCYRSENAECGWSSADYRNVDPTYILNKEFFSQGRCKSGSTTQGIEVAYYAYVTGDVGTADECIKAGDTALVDCEQYHTKCECWEQGVIAGDARCGWSSANNNCNYLSRFSQLEVAECQDALEWTAAHHSEFEAQSQSDMDTAAHVYQADRVWLEEQDQCYFRDGDVNAGFKATRCECFEGFIGSTTGPNGEPLTSCGWTGTKEEGMCQADAAWDVSDRPAAWAQEAFECLPADDKRALCDPELTITHACECAAHAATMPTLDYNQVEALAASTGNNYLKYVWEKVNLHINGDLYATSTPEEIRAMTPFLELSCWYDDNGNIINEAQHKECMSWQFCGWSSDYILAMAGTADPLKDNACFHGKYTSPEENVAEECAPPPPPPVVVPEPEPVPVYTYFNDCVDITDPIVCALYSIPEAEISSIPFNKACTWNSGAAVPCVYAPSIMELQEVLFPIQNGLILDAQVKVGGSITLDQHFDTFGVQTTFTTELPRDSWVPHLPTLTYSHPWRPFVEADTCFIISDIIRPYVPQTYLAQGAFDDIDSIYNCVVDTVGDEPKCTESQATGLPIAYPSVVRLTNPDTNAQYSSALEYIQHVPLKYIDVTLNNNEGPAPGFCDATCQAERQAVINLSFDSGLRAPLEGAADPNVAYTHALLVDLEGVPMLYDPCVNNSPEYIAAQDDYVAGQYSETGLFGS